MSMQDDNDQDPLEGLLKFAGRREAVDPDRSQRAVSFEPCFSANTYCRDSLSQCVAKTDDDLKNGLFMVDSPYDVSVTFCRPLGAVHQQ